MPLVLRRRRGRRKAPCEGESEEATGKLPEGAEVRRKTLCQLFCEEEGEGLLPGRLWEKKEKGVKTLPCDLLSTAYSL